MDMQNVMGRMYPARPPVRGSGGDRVRRALQTVEALRYAKSQLGEGQRRLYQIILVALSTAETWLELERGTRLGDAGMEQRDFSDLE